MKNRRQKLYLHRIKNGNGQWIKDKTAIESEIVNYFILQLNGEYESTRDELLQQVPRLITESENAPLYEFPSMEVIHSVVDSMNNTSSVRHDGFNGFFYKHCWNIIKFDLIDVILEFFCKI